MGVWKTPKINKIVRIILVVILSIFAFLIIFLTLFGPKSNRGATDRCSDIDMAVCEADLENNGCNDLNFIHDRSRDGVDGECQEGEICCRPLVNPQSCDLNCEDYHYSTCPEGCVAKCMPSCPVCLDCDGPGSCQCP
ncbi:hypothetical protein ACFL1B_06265 [Nanoarchaeota archaeon]